MSNNIIFTCIYSLNSFLDNLEKFKNTDDEYILPQQVYDEFIKQNDPKLTKKMIYSKRNKIIKVYDMQVLTDEHKVYKSILKGQLGPCLGRCESSAISIALHNNGILMTNDNERIISKIGNNTLKWININDLNFS